MNIKQQVICSNIKRYLNVYEQKSLIYILADSKKNKVNRKVDQKTINGDGGGEGDE